MVSAAQWCRVIRTFAANSRAPPNELVFDLHNNTALGSDGQGPKGFSFVFLDLFDFSIFLLTWRELAWVFLERPSRSCEVVVRMDCTSACTAASLDVGGPGPDLTW